MQKPKLNERFTFLTVEQQIELFAGCVYLVDSNKVRLPNGAELNKARFDIVYGGCTFPLDVANERTTRSAWTAFTANQAFRPPIA